MDTLRRLLCLLLSASLLFSLTACAAPQESVQPTEASEAAVVSAECPLTQAQSLLAAGRADEAEALLWSLDLKDEQVIRLIAQAEKVLSEPIEMDWVLTTANELPHDAQVLDVRLGRRSDGSVRGTIDYTASAGMTMTLSGSGFSTELPFPTPGSRDRLVFQFSGMIMTPWMVLRSPWSSAVRMRISIILPSRNSGQQEPLFLLHKQEKIPGSPPLPSTSMS